MSHFPVIVIGRDVKTLLAPYYEGLTVEPYDELCWCVGNKAHTDARKTAEEKHGTIESLHTSFAQRYPAAEDATNARWQQHIADYVRTEEEALAAHPDREKADPECEECSGTGHRTSTWNPQAKWDSYAVGGRWTGALSDYDPEKDPENKETCFLCGGTGKRRDIQAFVAGTAPAPACLTTDVFAQLRGEPPKARPSDAELVATAKKYLKDVGCNGCAGTGTALKWPTDWKSCKDDITTVKYLRSNKFIPFAVVTPDGAWHERGKMGWWASVTDEKDPEVWETVYRYALADLPDDMPATLVDCHV